MSLNFNSGKWWELSLTFAWPHQWFKIGWSIEEPDEKDRSFLLQIFLGVMSINIEWGNEDWWGDE